MSKFRNIVERRAFIIQVKDYFFLFLGVLLYSIGFNAFILPEKFVMRSEEHTSELQSPE